METLPELPPGIRMLTDGEAKALAERHPNIPSPRDCITCRGAGTFLAPGGVETRCNCEEQWILHRYLLHCGLGDRYQRLRWEDAAMGTDPGVLQEVQGWLDRADGFIRLGHGMVLVGSSGSGKTLLATLVLKKLLGLGYSGQFSDFSDLIAALKLSWFGDDAERLYERCRNVDVLVVDDVGVEHTKQVAIAGEGLKKVDHTTTVYAIESMLRHRVAHSKATIVTSNLSMAELSDRYGRHLKELLTEAADVYTFTGASHRAKVSLKARAIIDAGYSQPVVLG